MNSWIKFTEMLFGAGEHITTVGLLLAMCGGMVWLAFNQYKANKECNETRLTTAVEMGGLKADLASITAKLEAEQKGREEHLNSVQRIHSDILAQFSRLASAKLNIG